MRLAAGARRLLRCSARSNPVAHDLLCRPISSNHAPLAPVARVYRAALRRRVAAAGGCGLLAGAAAAVFTSRRCACEVHTDAPTQMSAPAAPQKQPDAASPDQYRLTRDHYSVWRGDGTRVSFDELIDSALQSDVILMGEEHDDRVTHALQLELFSTLHARLSDSRQLALAMEMFETDVQPVIDDYLGGHIREKDFLMDARPWNNYAADYKPLVEFAKSRGLPVVASNAPRRYVSLLGRGGGQDSLAALSPASQALLPPLPIPAPSEEYRQIFLGQMAPAMEQRKADASRPADSVWVAAQDGKSYEVEAIVARREGSKGEEYLVKWVGFGEGENTWEQASAVQGDVQRLLSGRGSQDSKGAKRAKDSSQKPQAAGDGACPYIGFDHTKLNSMLEAQGLWDASMAWTLAQFHQRTTLAVDSNGGSEASEAAAAGLVLHINGSFHSRGRRGIPERLAQYSAHAGTAVPAPRCLIVTCASCADVTKFPDYLAPFASSGGTGDDFIVLTDGMVAPSFEIQHPI